LIRINTHLLKNLLSKNANKKAELPFIGNPAIFSRPVAFRPCIPTGLAKKFLKFSDFD